MRGFILTAALIGLSAATSLRAQDRPPSLRDSFPLGTDAGVLCQVESKGRDPAIGTIFDRAWAIICRDAARPVGRLYALRGTPEAIARRIDPIRAGEAHCQQQAEPVALDGLGSVARIECRLQGADIGYRVYQLRKGDVTWVAEGLSGYDDALKLGLRTVVADRIVPGRIEVATTSINDPVAFARIQAGSLDPDRALAEGYRRNNAGAYAEAAEFFGTLQRRTDAAEDRTGEYLINEALQKSNLGQFAEADRLFEEAEQIPSSDRVQTRLRRNFLALHLINQRKLVAALAELDRPVAPLEEPMQVVGGSVEIGRQVAAEINAGAMGGRRLGTTEAGQLTPEERALILDAQAQQLRGTVYRLQGRTGEALVVLEEAARQALSVRSGRIVSIVRLRSQILAESGAAFEASGDAAGAENRFRQSIALLGTRYPDTNVMAAAQSRLAAFLVRQGRHDEALALYKSVVEDVIRRGNSASGMSNLLGPYFELLAQRSSDPAAVEDFFLATQTLVRPGVADTQAQLARQLSQGAGEAASLFRQATTLQREVERARIALEGLRTADEPDASRIEAATAELDRLSREQAAMQARLSDFPQYRALSTDTLTLEDLRAALKPDEAYLKLAVVGEAVYGVYLSQTEAQAYRLAASADTLERQVDALRATISTEEEGHVVTYPFDLALARKLYRDLTGPVADRVSRAGSLIFEPDGAMLRLPMALLPVDDASVSRHAARMVAKGADPFDFTGVKWLGRATRISTAVSARGFRDARRAPPSAATRPYLGFGSNAPAFTQVALNLRTDLSDPCAWPLSEWNKPISPAELRAAGAELGAGSEVVTGGAFTDRAVMERTDLADFRILHFATHGFVTAPRPQCPARPALLTSFGDASSDGLLSFSEIYDLHMDADLVLLSACDTAGRATVAATREAGVTTGGGSALDGLVRAFIGGGARAVLASHWPAPDEFHATERLITSLFRAAPGTSIAEALRAGELQLMDDPATSHPFYWAGFALVGDGAQPMLRTK